MNPSWASEGGPSRRAGSPVDGTQSPDLGRPSYTLHKWTTPRNVDRCAQRALKSHVFPRSPAAAVPTYSLLPRESPCFVHSTLSIAVRVGPGIPGMRDPYS